MIVDNILRRKLNVTVTDCKIDQFSQNLSLDRNGIVNQSNQNKEIAPQSSHSITQQATVASQDKISHTMIQSLIQVLVHQFLLSLTTVHMSEKVLV